MNCPIGHVLRIRNTTLRIAIGFAVMALVGMVLRPTLATAQQHAAATVPLVFDGVTVIDVQQGQRIQAQRVVIVGNRIQAVGSARKVRVPAGAKVVDSRGKYLIPGLWDMHTHPEHSIDLYYPLFIANGVTGIRNAGSSVPLDTMIQWRQDILNGNRVGPPRQLLAGPAVDEVKGCNRKFYKDMGYQHVCVESADSADARHVVDSLKAAGADFIKMYLLKRDMYFVIAAEARRTGIPFGGHLGRPPKDIMQRLLAVSDSGASILDHVNVAGGLNSLCLGDSSSIQQCRPVAERFQHNGTWWVPTLVIIEEVRDKIQNPLLNRSHRSPASDTILMRWNEFLRRFLADSTLRLDLQHGSIGDSAHAARAIHLRSPADTTPGGILTIAHRVGLPIMAGTDVSRASSLQPGFALQTELALYVAEGLTPLEALQTATLNPAKYLHGTDSLGTVTTGKLADLVLLDADPLADITNITKIRAVVANGRYFDRSMLDHLLTTRNP